MLFQGPTSIVPPAVANISQTLSSAADVSSPTVCALSCSVRWVLARGWSLARLTPGKPDFGSDPAWAHRAIAA